MTVRKIFLSWRPGPGFPRYIVGRLKRSSTKGVEFRYFPESVEKAQAAGFTSYPEFPVRTEPYNDGVLEIFARRLTCSDRADRSKVLDFWDANRPGYDTFDLLALTQGWLMTDNFEFLGQFHPIPDFRFVTDLAYVGPQKLVRDTIVAGDKLRFEFERDNQIDRKAIKVFKGKLFIGYIKQKHCIYFHDLKKKQTVDMTVRAVDQNGVIRQIFVAVGNP